jgi:hypothetical protein
MIGIYKFDWSCGRMGDLEGVFLADSAAIENAIGKQAYFGEVLGKHSEIYGPIRETDVRLISDSPSDVAVFSRLKLDSGFNPLDYIDDEEE